MRSLILLLLVVIITSCSNDKNYKIVKDGNQKLIKNFSAKKKNNIILEIKNKEVIKGIDNGETFFSEPSSFALDDEHNIYVVDKTSSTINKFDKVGRFVKKFGGKGNGPGEFISYGTWNNLYCKNDTLVFIDEPMRRIIAYSFQGKHLYTKQVLKIPIGITYLRENTQIGTMWNVEMIDKKPIMTHSFGLISSSLKIKKKLTNVKIDLLTPHNSQDSDFLYSVNKDNIFIADISEDHYLIKVYDLNLNEKYRFSKNYIKVPFTEESFKKSGFNKKNREAMKYHKSIAAIFSDYKGNLWVFSASEKNKEGVFNFDVFNKGIYLGKSKLHLPDTDIFSLSSNVKVIGNKIYYLNIEEAKLEIITYNLQI